MSIYIITEDSIKISSKENDWISIPTQQNYNILKFSVISENLMFITKYRIIQNYK
jgi:hypothetical protein